tara:strand:+ start:82 stop:423 length:342 start_codon:yes stop_codon:yes gene_type:complete
MRTLIIYLITLPILGICQGLHTTLEVQMFNNDRVVVSLDGKQFDVCSKFRLSGVSAGDHQLKVYKAKQYINPNNHSISERLVPIYSGKIYLVKDQKTTCIINKYHQKEIEIKN